MSVFITFEGGDGSGKSVQTEKLFNGLQNAGVRTLLVREPGSTPLGDYLSQWLKRETPKLDTISPISELFLFTAARAELVSKIIAPALRNPGMVVVSDRYADSTTAYQGYGRGLPLDEVAAANVLAVQGVMPQLTLLLDCKPEEGLARIGPPQIRMPLGPDDRTDGGRMDLEGTRRFEQESLEFHNRVRTGYLAMAEAESARWHVVDATMTVDEIADQVWSRVQRLLSALGAPVQHDSTPLFEQPSDSASTHQETGP